MNSIGHAGNYYNQTSDWQDEHWRELMALFKTTTCDVHQVRTVLDIGCGTGKETKRMLDVLPAVSSVVGVDINPLMLETARSLNAADNIQYLELGAEKLEDLRGQVFDVVVSNFVLHWVADKEKVLTGLSAVTRPGSYLMLGTCEALPSLLADIDVFLREAFHVSADVQPPFYYYTLLEWAHVLARFGWTLEAVSLKRESHYTGDTESFLNHWVTASSQKICYGRWFDDLNVEQKQRLLSVLRDKYKLPQDDSFLFYEQTLLLVARKEEV